MTQNTKTALLDAAEISIRQRGYNGFSYADLAQAVGIRKASIHYHFPTKAKLAADLMSRYQKKVLAYCDKIDVAAPTSAAKLLGLMTFYREATAGGQQLCLCVALSGSPDSLTAEVTQVTNSFRHSVIDWLETVFEQALRDGSVRDSMTPSQEAPALLALLEGAQLAARASQDVASFDAATALFRTRCT